MYTIAPGLYHMHLLIAVKARLIPLLGGLLGVYGVPFVFWLNVNT